MRGTKPEAADKARTPSAMLLSTRALTKAIDLNLQEQATRGNKGRGRTKMQHQTHGALSATQAVGTHFTLACC